MSNDDQLKWRLLERLAHQIQSEEATPDLTVTPNTRLKGGISGRRRQVDVLVDARWDDGRERRIIIDAKHRRRKIDIKQVEEFEGMMRDCGAKHGVIVCTSGHTDAALRRAQDAISIRLVLPEEIDQFDISHWDDCRGSCCAPGSKWSSTGLVLWDPPHGLAINDSPLSIVAVGKCDVCNDFNIWCWDCGAKFALSSDDEKKCSCERFWLTATEEEEDGSGSAVHLFLILLPTATNGPSVTIPVDRRRLS